MTPKEKAEELVGKFRDKIISFLSDNMKDSNAKQCALIAVDEIIQLLDHTPLIDDDYAEHIINYWNEVKQEIEKL